MSDAGKKPTFPQVFREVKAIQINSATHGATLQMELGTNGVLTINVVNPPEAGFSHSLSQ